MKLYINYDNSASDVCFVIYDELGVQKYFAAFKKPNHNVRKYSVKIDITDTNKNTVAKIRQLTKVGVNTFSIKANNQLSVTFVMVKTQNGFQCKYYGNNWHICGDILTKNYTVIDVDNAIIATQKKLSGKYELSVTDDSNELVCLATAICINLINTVDKLAIQAV